jgi:microcompartment protein CcmK/EutM
MKVARVVGQVVGTQKHAQFDSGRLLVVRPESLDGLSGGADLIAVDRIGARPGERVLLLDDGAAARQLYGSAGPIRAVIVGVVDETHLESSREPS